MMSTAVYKKIRSNRLKRLISSFILLNLLIEVVSPTLALALTSGPSQPEFSSFEPVATTDMVNDFSGDFTYNLPILNVPGPDGAGYSMSLSYHSGVSAEEEASWVGYGWTLNAGAINRSMRGFPDEFNGVPVTTYNKTKPNTTQSSNFNLALEINSSDKALNASDKFKSSMNKFKKKVGLQNATDLSLFFNHSIRYNNYSGFSVSKGFGFSGFQTLSLSLNKSGIDKTMGISVSAQGYYRNWTPKLMKFMKEKANLKWSDKKAKNHQQKSGRKTLNFSASLQPSTSYNFSPNSAPALIYSVAKNYGISWNVSVGLSVTPETITGYQTGFGGNLSIQANKAEETKDAYGYMHSYQCNNPDIDKGKFDFQIEKATTFDKHDENLGIPFNNADQFVVTGSKVNGGFRLFQEAIGSYYPEHVENLFKKRNIGAEVGIGTKVQVGFNIGSGRQKTNVTGKWKKMPSLTNKVFSNNLPSMHFLNDVGGEIDYCSMYGADDIIYAQIEKKKRLTLDQSFELKLDNVKKGNSSNIQHDPTLSEFSITGKDGSISEYKKGLKTRNQTELSIGLDTEPTGKPEVFTALYHDDPLLNQNVVGQKINQEYKNTYLLTAVKSANYIDADGDSKLSNGDYGSWTKFVYRDVYGGDNAWYRYRAPYCGLTYDEGRMVDKKDQTGSASSGEKEIAYLSYIETKTHIAYFITNTLKKSDFTTNFPSSDHSFLYENIGAGGNQPKFGLRDLLSGSESIRYDGVDAAGISGGMDLAANTQAKGSNHLERLEKIVLISKTDASAPITTTYFDYDYSLCKGITNTTATNEWERGKLTLKKVWTESNGIQNSKIAPYQFHYNYFKSYSSEILAKYDWANNMNKKDENPNYTTEVMDAWGFYRIDGLKRFENMQPWLSQKAETEEFDPAAWNLKRIQLPSGGEIHIHYEQKDYTKVQNKDAMQMVKLLDFNTKNGYESDETVYAINTEEFIPSDASHQEIDSYIDKLKNYFIPSVDSLKRPLYFKVLYTMIGNDKPKLRSNQERYNYASGYTVVNKIEKNGTKILFHLGNLKKRDKGKKDKTLPRYVCYEELLTNGGKNLGADASEYKDDDYTGSAYNPNSSDVEKNIREATRINAVKNATNMFVDLVGPRVFNFPKSYSCLNINFDLSYFKLPIHKSKKGGGIRVKRLLKYDPGISGETGSEMIYGNEYFYRGKDGLSSGVATNEPSDMREENALVDIMKRDPQGWFDRITNGRDTKQFEGPVGESILPSPSVGHSRIEIHNIHSGSTSSGYSVNEYFTCADFPFSSKFSPIDKKANTYRKFNWKIPLIFFNMEIHRAWVTQGYVFKTNDMHGKIKSSTTFYAKLPNQYNEKTSSLVLYNYSQPGEAISTLIYDKATSLVTRSKLSSGTQEDYSLFTSNVEEVSNDLAFEVDLNIVTPIAVYPTIDKASLSGSLGLYRQQLCQHVTTKVVSQTSHLLSTTNITDGVVQTTENLAFDRYTGDPILTRTFDGYVSGTTSDSFVENIKRTESGIVWGNKIFTQNSGANKQNGYYYSLNIPAYWMYDKLGPKSLNPTNTNELSAIAGNVVTYNTNALASVLANPSTHQWSPTNSPLTNVVSASATQYKNNWFTQPGSVSNYPALSNPAVLTAANSFYYPERTYSYKDVVSDANSVKIYQGGVVTSNFKFFNWTGLQQNPASIIPSEWYSPEQITQYSPYGYPVEEKDALGIKSSAQFGYDNTLPVLIAKNSELSKVKFIDFEYNFAGNNNVTQAEAHSGKSSLLWSSDQNFAFHSNYDLDITKGTSIKLWLKSSICPNTPSCKGYKNPNPKLKALIGGTAFDLKPIAQTGDWTLFSTNITQYNGLQNGSKNILLSYNLLANESVYVDDFRIQPIDAAVSCMVYYPDHKLAAQFDDQHFGVFYEYNGKGQLVRKSIETERGRKTLTEQQYHVPLINNN